MCHTFTLKSSHSHLLSSSILILSNFQFNIIGTVITWNFIKWESSQFGTQIHKILVHRIWNWNIKWNECSCIISLGSRLPEYSENCSLAFFSFFQLSPFLVSSRIVSPHDSGGNGFPIFRESEKNYNLITANLAKTSLNLVGVYIFPHFLYHSDTKLSFSCIQNGRNIAKKKEINKNELIRSPRIRGVQWKKNV